MRKTILLFATCIGLGAIFVGYAQHNLYLPIKQHRIIAKKKEPVKVKKQVVDEMLCFPLEKDNFYSLYSYVIDLKNEKVKRQYESLFSRHNYQFTGYVWEGILQNILDNCPDKEISQNTFMKTQGDMICFTVTRYKAINKLPAYLCPILDNPKTLEQYIKKADRNRIHNF